MPLRGLHGEPDREADLPGAGLRDRGFPSSSIDGPNVDGISTVKLLG